jgi:hypothetical protein
MSDSPSRPTHRCRSRDEPFIAKDECGASPLMARFRFASQLTLKLFDTVTAEPLNAGTCARRKTDAMQPPTGVPANDPPATVAVVTRPLGANVTVALPPPVGPPGFLQLLADDAAALSAEIAEALLKGGASAAGAGSSFGFFVASLLTATVTGLIAGVALGLALALALARARALAAGL